MSDAWQEQAPAPAQMLTEDAARARILAGIEPLPPRYAPLLRAHGCFAVREAYAVQPLPSFDNSAMDGYAVAFAPGATSLGPGTVLRVSGTQAAGPDQGIKITPGEALRIFTGAPVPACADAVVMQEDVQRDGDRIVLNERVGTGEFIRRAGGDLARGQRLYTPGSRLTAQRIGLLASQGLAEVAVGGVPKAAVLTTGDELRPPGHPLGPGEIYESNGAMLGSLVAAAGAVPTLLGPARDDPADLDAKLAAGLSGQDVLIIAGGVSVGERDFVKDRLRAAGVELDLWRVQIKPGKPFLYGRGRASGTRVFGLPGNPVSAFVTFLLFVRPALLRLAGAANGELLLPTFLALTAEELTNADRRPHYLRGKLDQAGRFSLGGRQESHALYALSQSRALVRVDPGQTIAAGSVVRAQVWDL